jgi:hypothetical protein
VKPAFFAPKSEVAKKPPHGQPCNRCGLCCVGSLCPLGQHVFKQALGPCPALSYDEDGFALCGLIADPGKHALSHTIRAGGREKASEAAKVLNGAGLGCDARINGEAPDLGFYAKLRKWDYDNRKAVLAAMKAWGVK